MLWRFQQEKLFYLEYISDKTVVKEICNGTEKVIYESKDYGGYLNAAGEHCMIMDSYIAGDSKAENSYYTREIVLLK